MLLNQFTLILILDQVYIQIGLKKPKLVVDGQDFLCAEKKTDRTIWRCNQYYWYQLTRCKVKVITKGTTVEVVGEHNHPLKMKKLESNAVTRRVTIIRNRSCSTKLF